MRQPKRSFADAPSFIDKVYTVVRRIPVGRTMTYREVAVAAGRPHAARAVGNILHRNHDPAVPCHRVIRSDGTLGGYNRGAARKRVLLRREKAMV
ncbi:MAG: MGMT family protein [Patescibacteria group bacterium]|nr:MGMT family protein [Patescibacteria group bacterium]